MSDFKVIQLGVSAAKPSLSHSPSCTVVDYRNNLFMIDCGEGAQRQFMLQKLKQTRLNNIFLTHLHGDHVFGLPGLIGTLALSGKKGSITIHTTKEGVKILSSILDYFCKSDDLEICFNILEPTKRQVAFENKSLIVTTVPLRHRIPTMGYIFREKEKPRHIRPDMIEFYGIPISQIAAVKSGADFVTPDGRTIPNCRLTTDPTPSRMYAHIGDTLYTPGIVEDVRGADLLFHETTYLEENSYEAKKRFHSTARQAATLARDAEVKCLLTGHYSSRYPSERFLSEAQEVFPNVVLGNEGVVVDI